MKCKHAKFRRAYRATTPPKSDAEIRNVIRSRSHSKQHYVQVWRQFHVAEARKRGLL